MIATQIEIVVGGLYAVQNEDGTFGVYKVLAIDWDIAVSLRKYTNKFESCPSGIDPTTLTLGMSFEEITVKGIDLNSIGIGHFPLHRDGFREMKPVLIQVEKVADDELDGYRMWMQGGTEPDSAATPQQTPKRWWQIWK